MWPWRNLEQGKQTQQSGERMADLPMKPGFQLVERDGRYTIEPEQSTQDRSTEPQRSTGTRRRQR